jgi:hypothetical protein
MEHHTCRVRQSMRRRRRVEITVQGATPATAIIAKGPTSTEFMSVRSTMTALSATVAPATLCPPQDLVDFVGIDTPGDHCRAAIMHAVTDASPRVVPFVT